MKAPISVLLVDDHRMLREALRDFLESVPDIEVVGEADEADRAVGEAVRLQPDVVCMDIVMPGASSFSAAGVIRSRCPNTRILFVSAFALDQYIQQALELGASGFVTKEIPCGDLISAVRTVATGRTWYSDSVRSRILAGEGAHTERTRAQSLTARELEVLGYLAQGMDRKTIARTMHLSVKTVENHCTRLMNKLDIHDRVELTLFAVREGLVQI